MRAHMRTGYRTDNKHVTRHILLYVYTFNTQVDTVWVSVCLCLWFTEWLIGPNIVYNMRLVSCFRIWRKGCCVRGRLFLDLRACLLHHCFVVYYVAVITANTWYSSVYTSFPITTTLYARKSFTSHRSADCGLRCQLSCGYDAVCSASRYKEGVVAWNWCQFATDCQLYCSVFSST